MSVEFSRKRLQPSELISWRITKFVFCAYGTSTHSASALNQESAEQKGVIVRITLLHGADRVFPTKQSTNPNTIQPSGNTGQSKATTSQQLSNKSRTMSSVTDVKGLLQGTELQFFNFSGLDTKAFVLCDTACSNSCGR